MAQTIPAPHVDLVMPSDGKNILLVYKLSPAGTQLFVNNWIVAQWVAGQNTREGHNNSRPYVNLISINRCAAGESLLFHVFVTGQRLFRRSTRGSRSLSESSSVEQPEEGAAEASPSHSSSSGNDSADPGMSQPASEEEPQPVGGATQQTVQEADVQVEADEASQLSQPEDLGAEPELR